VRKFGPMGLRRGAVLSDQMVRPARLELATSWFVAISRPLRTNMHTRRWSNIDGHKRAKDRGVGMTPNHMVSDLEGAQNAAHFRF
jgi:hypothetical protein